MRRSVGEAGKPCFCNGPLEVNPFFAPYPLPGSCFCTGSALGCRLMVFEEDRAGPILDARGCRASPRRLLQGLRPDPIHRPGRDAASGRLVFILPENQSNASPYVPQRAAGSFSVWLNGVSPSRPEFRRAPRAVAVNTGRRPSPQAARSGVDGREHGAMVDEAGPLMPLPPLLHRRGSRQPACGAGSLPASWPVQPWPSASPRAWRASPPSSSRPRL